MKKTLALLIMVATALLATAQPAVKGKGPSHHAGITPRSSMTLDINSLTQADADRINQYIATQKDDRGLVLATIGQAVAAVIITSATSTTIDQVMKLTQLRKTKQREWNMMIKNECQYIDSLTYLDNLSDFYSKGSFNGALDPADLNFNGFTLHTQRDGQDVLRFYCHVATDEAGIAEIFNHSKFHLVLDSMYFYPYNCHLPNLESNHIFVEKDREYERNTHFSFDERNDLMVTINFTVTSSWYNEALLLSKDMELGVFSVQVPIEERYLTDSVFVYKRGMRGMPEMNIAGDCFIVPRSYMPLTNGKAHWGTGEYNVKVTVGEECEISREMQKHWRSDYRQLKRMKKDNEMWQQFTSFCGQNGQTLLKVTLDKASAAALNQWDFMQGAMSSGASGRSSAGMSGQSQGSGTPSGGMPGGN
jgi:hypothetical protein